MEEQNINSEKSIELAVEFMETPYELTKVELREITEDDCSLQACKDLLDCKNAVMQEYSRAIPNVDKEWDKFHAKKRRRSTPRIFVIGGLAGIVASFAFILLFSWMKDVQSTHDGVMVFQANDQQQQVVLQTSTGKHIALSGTTQDHVLTPLGANVLQTGSKSLKYNQTANQEKVEMHTLTTPRGMDFKVVLADGTTVWLNAESKLEYPSHFIAKERTVRLQGEAYFEVSKDKEHPFIVQTGNLQTRVLGTQFNVRNYSTYDSHVTLIEGSVEVRNAKGKDYTRIKPGEDAHLQVNGSFALKQVDVDSYVYWKEGFFYFDNVPLVDIMQSLGRWYNVNIVFNNKAAMDYKMHYLCDRKGGLEHAITLLNRMKKVDLKQEGNTLYVR